MINREANLPLIASKIEKVTRKVSRDATPRRAAALRWNFRSPVEDAPNIRERSSQELVPYKADGETFKNTRGAPLALRYRAAAGDLAAATLPWRGERGGFRAGENESPVFLSSIIKDKSAAGRARTRHEMDLSSV